jgi:hypothetical protein
MLCGRMRRGKKVREYLWVTTISNSRDRKRCGVLKARLLGAIHVALIISDHVLSSAEN